MKKKTVSREEHEAFCKEAGIEMAPPDHPVYSGGPSIGLSFRPWTVDEGGVFYYLPKEENPFFPYQRPSGFVQYDVLPPRPESLICTCAYNRKLPAGYRAPRYMGESTFLGMVEWSWGFLHNRLDTYYLSKNEKGTHWILWNRDYDEWAQDLAPRWKARKAAFCLEAGVEAMVAACYLLRDTWEFERDQWDLDRFHFVTTDGMLSDDLLRAMADQVWGEEE